MAMIVSVHAGAALPSRGRLYANNWRVSNAWTKMEGGLSRCHLTTREDSSLLWQRRAGRRIYIKYSQG